MKKVKIILITTAMLLLSACEKNAEEVVPTPEPTPTPIPTLEEQTKIILDNKEEWEIRDFFDEWAYTITDLDHNGRYEVIVSCMQGSGYFTYSDYFEVNESFDGIKKCDFDAKEGNSEADIIVDKCLCFYDETSDTYYYYFKDSCRISAFEYLETDYAVSLKESKIQQTPIVSRRETTSDEGNQVIYYNQLFKEIENEEYSKAVEKFFDGMKKTNFEFSWVKVEPEIKNESIDIMAADLFEGYGFYHTQCQTTGTYKFTATNSDDVQWQVYILDEEFKDAERFIPQAYECKLSGDGSLEIKENQWLYVYCSCNSWTMEQAPEGCKYSYEIVTTDNIVSQEDAVIITKNPTSETFTIGGKSWFIAHADNADKLLWQFIDPSGEICTLDETKNKNPGLSLQELDGDTLAVSNVPQSLDGWSVQAVFSGKGGTATTNKANIYVSDYIASYADVINEYKKFANGNYSGTYVSTSVDEALTNSCNADSNGIGFLATSTQNLGYYLKDLNKDGIPELLIGSNTADYYDGCIIDLFTLQNGQPKRVVASSERCKYYLRSDNMISCVGSSGASYSSTELLRFNSDGITMVNAAVLYGNDSGEINYYRVLDVDFDYSNDQMISQEEYEAIDKEITSSNIKFSVIEF